MSSKTPRLGEPFAALATLREELPAEAATEASKIIQKLGAESNQLVLDQLHRIKEVLSGFLSLQEATVKITSILDQTGFDKHYGTSNLGGKNVEDLRSLHRHVRKILGEFFTDEGSNMGLPNRLRDEFERFET
ncbi:MAG: hypothetical protein ABIH35_04645 [Patescibacteria group bacterium]